MSDLLKKAVSKIAAVALLGVTLAAIYVVGVEPIVARFSSLQDEISQKRILLGKMGDAASKEGAAREMEQRIEASNLARALKSNQSEALKLADLQTLVGKAATSEGLQVESLRKLPSQERGGVQLIGVEAHFRATIEQAQRIVMALENEREYVFVDALHILTSEYPQGQAASGAEIDVRIELRGIAGWRKV